MTYSVAWNEAYPTATNAANLIYQYIQQDKTAVRERLDDIFGTAGGSQSLQTADPYRPYLLKLSGTAASKIIPGSTSFAVRDSTDAYNNLLVAENGDVTVRRNLSVPDGQAWVTRYTATTAASTTLDWNNGNVQYLSLAASITTLTLSNPQTGSTYLLEIKQGGSGSYTIAWPASVVWAGGTAPTLTTTVGRTDMIALYYNGTNYAASVVGFNFNV